MRPDHRVRTSPADIEEKKKFATRGAHDLHLYFRGRTTARKKKKGKEREKKKGDENIDISNSSSCRAVKTVNGGERGRERVVQAHTSGFHSWRKKKGREGGKEMIGRLVRDFLPELDLF